MYVLYFFERNYDGGEREILAVSHDYEKLEKEKSRLSDLYQDSTKRKSEWLKRIKKLPAGIDLEPPPKQEGYLSHSLHIDKVKEL